MTRRRINGMMDLGAAAAASLDEDDNIMDVKFLVEAEGGEVVTIKAHSQILALASPVFKSQFFGPLKEASKEISVKETTPEAFQKVVDYIYKGPLFKLIDSDNAEDDIDSENDEETDISTWEKLDGIISILHLAHKYQLKGLETMCEQSIVKGVRVERSNISDMSLASSELAVPFPEVANAIKEHCASFIASEIPPPVVGLLIQALSSPNFDAQAFKQILETSQSLSSELPGCMSRLGLEDNYSVLEVDGEVMYRTIHYNGQRFTLERGQSHIYH